MLSLRPRGLVFAGDASAMMIGKPIPAAPRARYVHEPHPEASGGATGRLYMFDRAMGYVMGRPSRFLEDLSPEVLPTALLQEEDQT